MARREVPVWLSRIEMLGTTVIVLLVGSLMIWYEAIQRGPQLGLTIGSGAVVYSLALVLLGRRSDPRRVAWWPFAVAGMSAGAVAELINAQFMVTQELLLACATGIVIGTAQWTALRVWIGLTRSRAA